jgi:hypothetical protein
MVERLIAAGFLSAPLHRGQRCLMRVLILPVSSAATGARLLQQKTAGRDINLRQVGKNIRPHRR